MARLAVALVHHPCVDRHGEIYTTSVTNLDVHDVARASRTYGVDTFYVVHPVKAQRELVDAIARFWGEGKGAARNRDRTEALRLIEIVETLDEAIAREAARGRPTVVATSARPDPGVVSTTALRARHAGGEDLLLVFGTGYGLAPEALSRATTRLAPLVGPTDYNHLSVRAAIAIYLDRLRALDAPAGGGPRPASG